MVDLHRAGSVYDQTPNVFSAQLTPEVFFELACKAIEVEDSDLKTVSRSRELSRQRRLIVGPGVKRRFQATKSLANLMNRKADTGTAWVRRCIERRTSDSVFDESYNLLDETLSVQSRTVKPE